MSLAWPGFRSIVSGTADSGGLSAKATDVDSWEVTKVPASGGSGRDADDFSGDGFALRDSHSGPLMSVILHGPRAMLGPPWTKDHRTALAATVLAASVLAD